MELVFYAAPLDHCFRYCLDNIAFSLQILLTYVMYNFDLGYVQGMSDLLAPILFVMDGNEVDAFWCFVGFMDRVKANFDFDQVLQKLQYVVIRFWIFIT